MKRSIGVVLKVALEAWRHLQQLKRSGKYDLYIKLFSIEKRRLAAIKKDMNDQILRKIINRVSLIVGLAVTLAPILGVFLVM